MVVSNGKDSTRTVLLPDIKETCSSVVFVAREHSVRSGIRNQLDVTCYIYYT